MKLPHSTTITNVAMRKLSYCGGLNENSPYWFIYLNALSPVGETVGERLGSFVGGGVSLVCGVRFVSKAHFIAIPY